MTLYVVIHNWRRQTIVGSKIFLWEYNVKDSFGEIYSPSDYSLHFNMYHTRQKGVRGYFVRKKKSAGQSEWSSRESRVKHITTAQIYSLTKISFKAVPHKLWQLACMLYNAVGSISDCFHCSVVSTNVEYMKRSAECEVAKSVWLCGDDWSQVKWALTGRRGWGDRGHFMPPQVLQKTFNGESNGT